MSLSAAPLKIETIGGYPAAFAFAAVAAACLIPLGLSLRGASRSIATMRSVICSSVQTGFISLPFVAKSRLCAEAAPGAMGIWDRRARPDYPFTAGDATRLPFDDSVFDAVTISFGLRNVVDHAAGLREMARAYDSGALTVTVEFSSTLNPFVPGSMPPDYVRVRAANFELPVFFSAVVGLTEKSVAASAVGSVDPGNLQRRWAPCVPVQGPGQGQLPWGSIRPRGILIS
mgnify:CR=1 FL=1